MSDIENSPRKSVEYPWPSSNSLAIAIFRVAVGVLGGVYFSHQFATIDLYLGEGQLVPTSSIHSSFGHPRPLISVLMNIIVLGESNENVVAGEWVQISLYASWGIGLLACLALVMGVFPRTLALLAFFAAVASTAWTYPLTYIDDSVVALSFFWVALLPEKIHRRSLLELRGQELAARVITYHVGVLYFLSGVWKLASPMWRRGDALATILMMPGSRFSEFWQLHASPIFPVMNYGVVVIEIALPVFLLSSLRKWRLFGVGMQWMLHTGIAVFMYVPYANLALAASSVLFLRGDLAPVRSSIFMSKVPSSERKGLVTRRQRYIQVVYRPFLVLYLLLILSAGLGELPGLRLLRTHQISQTILNAVGLHHGFRLFDWIDSRAFVPRWRLSWVDLKGENYEEQLKTIIPESMRSAIFSTYFVGQPWMEPLPHKRRLWKRQMAQQFNRRFCQKVEEAVLISAEVQVLDLTLDRDFRAEDRYYKIADRLPCSGLVVRQSRSSIPLANPDFP